MPLSASYRRLFLPLIILAGFTVLLWIYRTEVKASVKQTWQDLPQTVGLGESIDNPTSNAESPSKQPTFTSGQTKPNSETYSRMLVIPRMSKENVSWVYEGLPELETAVYVVDDQHAPLHPPQNKGHEVMVYLSYIIDFWDKLPEVSIFMHAHRFAWHNNELLDNDAVEMLRRLSSERIMREGYVNLRCHWDPGCPDWIHPGATEYSKIKKEQTMLARSWGELFPLDPIPKVLGVPCCAQFALSRDRIRSMPLERYTHLRDWLLRSSLSDDLAGRIFEYTWHYIFTSNAVECPSMHVCYCDLYGVCFGNERTFNRWFELRYNRREAESQLKVWKGMEEKILAAKEHGHFDEAMKLEVPELGRDMWLKEDIRKMKAEMDELMEKAKTDGQDPEKRAKEAGRPWKPGDGF